VGRAGEEEGWRKGKAEGWGRGRVASETAHVGEHATTLPCQAIQLVPLRGRAHRSASNSGPGPTSRQVDFFCIWIRLPRETLLTKTGNGSGVFRLEGAQVGRQWPSPNCALGRAQLPEAALHTHLFSTQPLHILFLGLVRLGWNWPGSRSDPWVFFWCGLNTSAAKKQCSFSPHVYVNLA
jgi:hypothetical protein